MITASGGTPTGAFCVAPADDGTTGDYTVAFGQDSDCGGHCYVQDPASGTWERRSSGDVPDDAFCIVPAPVTSSEPDSAAGQPLELEPFEIQTVIAAGVEAIGCWSRLGEGVDPESRFFAGWDGGFMVIDGEAVRLPNTTADERTVIPDVQVGLTFSGDGFAATLAAVGPERPTSIESSDRDVTLAVSTPDGRRTRIDGVLGCGVRTHSAPLLLAAVPLDAFHIAGKSTRPSQSAGTGMRAVCTVHA